MSGLWLAGVAGVVALLVIASIVVSVVRGERDVKEYAENTPEGVVQRYLRAIWRDDDPHAAYAYLSDELKAYCSYQHLRDTTQWMRDQGMRVSLVEAEPLMDWKTSVRVRVSQVSMGRPFTPEESSYTQSFTLKEQSAGVWRFVEPPWPMNYCPDWPGDGRPRKPVPAP